MIDEKKLIEEIERLREKYDEMCGSAQMNEEYGMEMMYAGKVTGLHEIKKFIMNQQKVGDWIPCSEMLPENDDYILLSFANFSLPLAGRYDSDGEIGGAFYLGDCDGDDTCISNNLFVNAWMPLPKPYQTKGQREVEE